MGKTFSIILLWHALAEHVLRQCRLSKKYHKTRFYDAPISSTSCKARAFPLVLMEIAIPIEESTLYTEPRTVLKWM